MAKAVGVGLVEVRKEKEADGAFGEFGEYASKVDRAVVVRVGRGATFEKRVDPVVSPQAWPSVGGEDFADEFGKWGGECERNGVKEESWEEVGTGSFVGVEGTEEFEYPPGADE